MKPSVVGNGTVSIVTVVALSAISVSVSASLLWLKRWKKEYEEEISKIQALREAERKGRIKAEILLRTTVKNAEMQRIAASSAFYSSNVKQRNDAKLENESISTNGCKSTNDPNPNQNDMLLKCVGEVVSPFLKRMGTPRQGALAPHARGYIQMNSSVAPLETLSGIEAYSHAWVLFWFHANTDCQTLSVKTKVRPPRAGGIKVGCMATRSPHRPNPIGLSLVKVVGLDEKKKRLYIAGLDLVNGTPVYDIKPCVPWDIPGHFDGQIIKVPDWVSQEDALSSVTFTPEADDQLQKLINCKTLDPLYEATHDGFAYAKKAISEVLSQDPRASKRRGKIDEKIEPYKISFGTIQLQFLVSEMGKVSVVGATKMQLDDCLYVDGVPLAIDGTMR